MLFPSVSNAKAEATVSAFELKANGINYRIFTSEPVGVAPATGFPVIYLLDGNTTFPLAQKWLAENDDIQAVLVGIGYPIDNRNEIIRLRYFDLTPETPADLVPSRDGKPAPRTGGRDAFHAFVQKTVRSEIERRFPIDRSRQTLFGHSLSGLFTLQAMFDQPNDFQIYSAADPSIWWNNRSVLKHKDAFVSTRNNTSPTIRLFIETSGKRVNREGQTAQLAMKMDTLRGGPSGSDIYAELSRLPGIHASYKLLADESHGSMLPFVVNDTLDYALRVQTSNLTKK
ncbi:alpha/beta hydrolase [Paraburkholderia aspalathi]|nr:alpha/beta hydrolase [Paraburkholderia aspalathi]